MRECKCNYFVPSVLSEVVKGAGVWKGLCGWQVNKEVSILV